MVRFLYAHVVLDSFSEIYCSAIHKESLAHSLFDLQSTDRWAQIWFVKTAFWVPYACRGVKKEQTFQYSLLEC